jgi:hypothetical protein
MRQLHRRLVGGRDADPHEDFAMGALAGAAAAAATTPLDVVKTRMMVSAASRPTMLGAAGQVLAAGGPGAFFTGVGARALSNGINSAVFFCAFEAIRGAFQRGSLRAAAPTLEGPGGDEGEGDEAPAVGRRRVVLQTVPLQAATVTVRALPGSSGDE